VNEHPQPPTASTGLVPSPPAPPLTPAPGTRLGAGPHAYLLASLAGTWLLVFLPILLLVALVLRIIEFVLAAVTLDKTLLSRILAPCPHRLRKGRVIVRVGLRKRHGNRACPGDGFGARATSWDRRKLLQAQGADYARHFQYVILEIADTHVGQEYLLARESHWKEALQTRKHGYNAN
jgi:hypothetical protein